MINTLKNKLKQVMPKKLSYWYYLYTAKKAVNYDIRRRVHDKIYNNLASEKVKRDLTLLYHIVEKGLTMPEPRPGFGKQVVIDLCKVVLRYERMKLDLNELEFSQSVTVLKEYAAYHTEIGFKLDDELIDGLSKIIHRFEDVHGTNQLQTTEKEYFESINASFDVFNKSRYSVRSYTKKLIPIELLMDCVNMAQKSPSFCNRQPTRVHLVKSAQKIDAILSIQNGNRGFGHLAETLIVLTSVISVTKDIHERNENHLNGGMFAMTLLQALHYHRIAACSLNWSVDNTKDSIMRKILNVPENEVVLLVISCGFPPETFKIASSPRKKAQEITTVHL
jgi:nitroreductase